MGVITAQILVITAKNLNKRDNGKNWADSGKIGLIRWHQASHNFVEAKLQSIPGADNPHYTAGFISR